MEITDDLLGKWEPKVQRFLKTSFVLGMDKEDLGQELRFAILKAAQGFDETRGTSFHTYLHTSMINTLRTLITKAQKQKDLHTATSIDGTYYNTLDFDDQPQIPQLVQKALEDPIPTTKYSEIEIQDLLIRSNLNKSEIRFVNLRIEGLTMAEITQELNESSYKLRHTVKRKLGRYITDINWLGEDDADEED